MLHKPKNTDIQLYFQMFLIYLHLTVIFFFF